MKEKFIKDLEDLSRRALAYSGIHRDYTDKNLMDAIIVLNEILLAKTYDKHKGKLNKEQMEQLVTELGHSIRQTVLVFSGIDTLEVYNK